MIGIRRAVLEDAENLYDFFEARGTSLSLTDLISLLRDDGLHFYTLWEGRELLGGFCFELTEGVARLNFLLLSGPGEALSAALSLTEARYPGLKSWTAGPALDEQALKGAGFTRRKGSLVRPAVHRRLPYAGRPAGAPACP